MSSYQIVLAAYTPEDSNSPIIVSSQGISQLIPAQKTLVVLDPAWVIPDSGEGNLILQIEGNGLGNEISIFAEDLGNGIILFTWSVEGQASGQVFHPKKELRNASENLLLDFHIDEAQGIVIVGTLDTSGEDKRIRRR